MERPEIYQHVIDALGRILVDKDPIRDDALITELFLDTQDFEQFFSDLQTDFGIALPLRIKSELSDLPDSADYHQMTLDGFVDVIAKEMKEKRLAKR
ncbi:hypothetical protein [Pseudomonas huanghezhanensis]|uniref:hypothetical protein n=1 Tax=Pseudomonas huanghezhanensis TaxID=3002903 RepID=UPI002286B637|nr:hypothetical protein [Pseudomonas sp. BSw22131]